ncbi:MAG: GNAT family protein [Planctomycetota bacterium]|nr:GNAT family protein [Planctomycetota bacterium]
MFKHVINDSLYLALLEPRHSPALFQAVDDNRDYLRRWLPWVDATQQQSDSRQFIDWSLKQFLNGNGMHTGIWFESILVGVVGFASINSSNSSGSIGYWLVESAQGNGLVTQSCRAIIRHGFCKLKLNRIEIRCAVDNSGSRRIPERLGFQYEGTLRDVEKIGERYLDHAVYSLIRRDNDISQYIQK